MFLKSTVLFAIIFFSSLLVAQEKDTVIIVNDEGINDTVIIGEDEWGDDGEDWEDMDWSFDFDDYDSKPAISLNYGLSKLGRDDVSAEFGEPNLIEVKLGYSGIRTEWEDDVIKFNYKFFRFSNVSTELSNKNFSSSELESNMWRFGFGREKGYGWKFGQSAIILYNAYALDWTRLEMKQLPFSEPILVPFFRNPVDDRERLLRYNESFRFGTSAEGGIKFKIISGITIEAAYERSIVFERHLFWKWAGSAVIEAASQALLDKFISEVMDASPYAAPFVNFVLKNALSYGIYELRQEKMNWPFNSAPPLAYDQFKFGLTFMF